MNHFSSNSNKLNSLQSFLWLAMATIPSWALLNTTLGPIPHPKSIPSPLGTLIKELKPLYIFVETSALSFDEQLIRMGLSAFISRYMATNSIKELALTVKLLSTWLVAMLSILKVPSLPAQKTISALKREGWS